MNEVHSLIATLNASSAGIANVVDVIKTVMEQIAATSEEQVVVSESIARSITDISTATNESATSFINKQFSL